MLRIRINQQEVDVGKISMSITRNSLFRWWRLENSFIYNFTLPLSNPNRLIFGFPEDFHVPEIPDQSYEIDVQFEGVKLLDGTAKVVRINMEDQHRGTVEIIATTEAGNFFDSVSSNTMQDFEFGGRINYSASSRADFLDQVLADGIDISNEKFFIFPIRNRWLEIEIPWQQPPQPGDPIICQNTLIIIGNPPEPKWIHTLLPPVSPIVTPFFRTGFILNKLLEELGYTVERNDLQDHPELTFEVMYNPIDIGRKFPVSGPADYYIEPKDHVPNREVVDWFTAVMDYHDLSPWFNHLEKKVQFIFSKNLLSDSRVLDLGKSIKPGNEQTPKRLLGGNITIEHNTKGSSNQIEPIQTIYSFGNGKELETQIAAGHPAMDDTLTEIWNETSLASPQISYIRPPHVDVPIVATTWPDNTWNNMLCFILYRGLQTAHEATSGSTCDFPTGNTDLWGHDQNPIPGLGFSLKLENDDQLDGSGLIGQLHSFVINWLMAGYRELRRYLRLSPNQFSDLDPAIKIRADQLECMVKSAKVDIQDTAMSLVEIDMVKT
jgi:hypothetical protein